VIDDQVSQRQIGVYIHWPYCTRICPYCDFNVVRRRGHEGSEAKLAEAIEADLRQHREWTGPRDLVSIYFGGGTPSLMPTKAVRSVIDLCKRLWTPVGDLEISLEANPGDASSSTLESLAHCGINRLSLGVQSLEDGNLKFLGRDHDAAQARKAVTQARALFERVSVDAIYGLPDQTLSAWKEDLQHICALEAGHISTYQLTIEAGTACARAAGRGTLTVPDQDVSADLYDLTQSVLAQHGYDAYEISNHARTPQDRSRHNLVYWSGTDYVGVGPGAHGRVTNQGSVSATQSHRQLKTYIDSVANVGCGHSVIEALTPESRAEERLLLGLRLQTGLAFSELTALGLSASDDRVRDLVDLGLVRPEPEVLAVTYEGRRLLDAIIRKLVL